LDEMRGYDGKGEKLFGFGVLFEGALDRFLLF
jgi:hypothetical protein